MTTVTSGRRERPKLSLNYEAKAEPGERKCERRSPTLSTLELRRLVAEMLG